MLKSIVLFSAVIAAEAEVDWFFVLELFDTLEQILDTKENKLFTNYSSIAHTKIKYMKYLYSHKHT